jgi:hypothetical protein
MMELMVKNKQELENKKAKITEICDSMSAPKVPNLAQLTKVLHEKTIGGAK